MTIDNGSQQPSQDVTLTAAVAILITAYTAMQSALILKFAALIAKYGASDLLQFQLRKAAQLATGRLGTQVPALVAAVVGKAAHGGLVAGGNIPREPSAPLFGDSFESHAERAARAIREDLEGKLNGLNYRITRFADDIYRAVVADAALDQVMGRTPAQAQHDAYVKLMRNGIDGFVDSKGRNWELTAYVDMAVRTAAERAYNVSNLDRMQSRGITYFVVSDDGHPCPLCAPWQGVVLTTGIPDDIAQHTIEEATAAGLFHPRCRHILTAFIPGFTVVPSPHKWNADDQRKYDESQKQRALERAIRSAKRQLDGAFTPEMKTAAKSRLRVAQANMRDFIDQTGRVRIPRREQLTL